MLLLDNMITFTAVFMFTSFVVQNGFHYENVDILMTYLSYWSIVRIVMQVLEIVYRWSGKFSKLSNVVKNLNLTIMFRNHDLHLLFHIWKTGFLSLIDSPWRGIRTCFHCVKTWPLSDYCPARLYILPLLRFINIYKASYPRLAEHDTHIWSSR